jgi:hypothetical protein
MGLMGTSTSGVSAIGLYVPSFTVGVLFGQARVPQPTVFQRRVLPGSSALELLRELPAYCDGIRAAQFATPRVRAVGL